MFLDFIKDINNYESRKVERIDNEKGKTIGVSTAYTTDEGYETALCDSNGIHPVERYKNEHAAKKGHKKWAEFAKNANGKNINKLGWTGISIEEDVLLHA